MGHEMNGEEAGMGQSGWDATRSQYVCKDSIPVEVPRRTADIRYLNQKKTLPSSGVIYVRDVQKRLQPRIAVSGVGFDRGMRVLFGGSEGVRTIIFPSMIRTVRQASFCEIESLLKAVLNEGLEVLGADEFTPDGKRQLGVFEESGLKDVRLPSTLKRIGYGVFAGCKNLKAVCLPEGLEYLGIACFQGVGLKRVDFPASLRTISQVSFSLCKNLKSVRFAEGLEALGVDEYTDDGDRLYGAFQKSALESISLPSTLKRIEYNTFAECKNLKSVRFPERLEYLGKFCFKETGLKKVDFPASLKTISQASFFKCVSLRSAKFAEGLEVLGTDERRNDGSMWSGAFQESALESVRLPSTLKRIEYQAFMGCENLKSVRFPKGLEYLGIACFSETGLENVDFPASLRTISQASFSECESLKSVKFAEGLEVLGTDDEMFYGAFMSSALESVKLPSTLKRIGYQAFAECNSLKTVKLPDGLEYLGEECFQESGLESIKIPPMVKTIEALTFCECRNLKRMEFSEGLERIGVLAFSKSSIECVDLPSTVRTICAGAFAKCANLRNVQLNEGLEVLGTNELMPDGKQYPGIFSWSGLRDVKLPSTLKRIEYGVFAGCKNLKAVCLPEGLEYLGKACFSVTGIENIEFPPSLRTISQASFSECENLKSAKFAEGLETLGTDDQDDSGRGRGVFYRSALESILLPSTLKRIEYNTFAQCKSLKTVELPEALEYLGEECFQESGLESIRLPSTLKRIEYRTFAGCRNLKAIELLDGLGYIGKECFQESGLESIKIPPALKTIEEQTFYQCENLKRVEFSEGLEKIGSYAFYESGIEQVKLPSSVRSIDAEAFAVCADLCSVRLNEGLETLGKVGDDEDGQGEVFQYSALESIVIPSTLEVLEQCTFNMCENLTSVVFAEGSRLKEIRKECFAFSALKTFEAPPSLRKIDSGAFRFCFSLQRVVLNEGLETVGTDSEESSSEDGTFKGIGIKEIVLPSTLVKLGENSFRECYSLKRVWVEQRCQVRIADYFRSKVDVRVFRAEDGNPLDSIMSSAGNGK